MRIISPPPPDEDYPDGRKGRSGRKPLGARAMMGAERSRRYRVKKRAALQ